MSHLTPVHRLFLSRVPLPPALRLQHHPVSLSVPAVVWGSRLGLAVTSRLRDLRRENVKFICVHFLMSKMERKNMTTPLLGHQAKVR